MNFWFDLKYAWRLLTKSWGYSLMCATVVALSVGLAVWANSLAYSQVWKQLEFPGSGQWYSIQIAPNATTRPRALVDAYTYQRLLEHNRSADHLGAFTDRVAVLGENQASASLRAGIISPRLLAATGVVPQLGRTFEEADARAGATPVAMLSFDTWQSYFGGDPKIVGRSARIDAAPVQIVGVMPKGFFAFSDFQLWTPLHLPKLARPSDSTVSLSPLIVVKSKDQLPAVLEEMKTAVRRVNGDHPDLFHAARQVALIRAARMFNHGNTPIVAMIGFLAAGVLLLGCVNISMVFLARLLERSRELALRNALGASRARILRQCLLETALIVMAGLVAGYGFAAAGVTWAQSIGTFLNRILATGRIGNSMALRWGDLTAAIGAAALIWLLSTLIPAWRVTKRDPASVLAGSGKGSATGTRNRSVGILVGLQVVISCLVLAMCGSLVLAIEDEVNKPSGIDSAKAMLSTQPTVFGARYAEPAQRLRYWDDLQAAIQSRIPGADVAFMTASPTRAARMTAAIESRQSASKEGALTLPYTAVSENYFELLGIEVRSGRLFDSTDDAKSLNVAVVDEEMAARYWPDGNVIGKRVQLNGADQSTWLTIVGVVSAVAGRPYRGDEIGVMYRPLRQAVPQQFQLLVKQPGGGDRRAALRAAAFAVDRDLPLHNLQTLDDYLAAVNISYNAIVPVVFVIALITAMLAASGLFGLISRSVAQRTQEVGIRRALGGTSWRATSMFRNQGLLYLSVSLAGVALGIGVTTLMSAIFTNILQQVPPVTVGVIALMGVIVFTASYFPSRRAVALEPGDALRYE